MRRLPKRPRTFGRTKAKPYPQERQEVQSRRLTDGQIQFSEELSPGFAEWYRGRYDEHGLPIPGLWLFG